MAHSPIRTRNQPQQAPQARQPRPGPRQGLLNRLPPEVLQRVTSLLAARGRGGDTRMGHLTEGETVVPQDVAAQLPGGKGALLTAFKNQGMDPGRYIVGGRDDSINPKTGIREFFTDRDGDGFDDRDPSAPGFGGGGGGFGGQGPESQDVGDDGRDRDGFGGSDLGGGSIGDHINFGDRDEGGSTSLPVLTTKPELTPAGGDLFQPATAAAPAPTPAPTPAPVPTPTPAPAPGPAFVPQDASVAAQLENFLASDSPLLTQARTQAAQAANRRGLLNSSLAIQAGEAAALNAALPIASQQAAQIQQANLQRGQIAATEILQGRQIASSESLGFADIASREAVSEAGIAAQERIAASQITAFDREKATAAVAQIDATYQSAFSSIMANPELPAEARNASLLHIAAIRDTNFNLVEQLFNISLVWTSAVAA